jgi:hypothetical protein
MSHMVRTWIKIAEQAHESMREILIEEQFHCGGTINKVRSRSAA